MSENEHDFKKVLLDKKIPILTIDNKWHQLFTQMNATPKVKKLEGKINDLLKEQGKYATENKKLKIGKKKVMDEMIQLRNQLETNISTEIEQQLDEQTQLLNDCNERLEDNQEAADKIPKELEELNYELMEETMEIAYKVLRKNSSEIMRISIWINEMRDTLKENVVKRQEYEMVSQDMYSYMHDIFGPEVISIFDVKYSEIDPED
ncbi:MAG: hypothetical protein R3Y54_02595 [Eubacteriales bacterium]